MFPAQEEADRTVFVGNLEARVREEILYELFLQVPSVGKGRRRGRGARSRKRSRRGGRAWTLRAQRPLRPDLGPGSALAPPGARPQVSSRVVKWRWVRPTPRRAVMGSARG